LHNIASKTDIYLNFKDNKMDIILFGSISVILVGLAGLLVIILKDHNHAKKQFDFYIRESQQKVGASRDSGAKIPKSPIEDNLSKVATSPKSSKKKNKIYSPQEEFQTPQTANNVTGSESAISLTTPLQQADRKKRHSNLKNGDKNAEIKNRSYKPFDYHRLLDMGLDATEADDFVIELIHQLEEATIQIKKAVASEDLRAIENITHSMKGAALNVGEGGVADILVDFNTYMKQGDDIEVALAYLDRLKESISDLKVEFSQVA